MTTPLLGVQEIAEGVVSQATKHNTALRQIEALTIRALSITETTPPGGEAEGDVYIVATGGTGPWSGKDKQLAVYIGGAYSYFAPKEGFLLWVNDQDTVYAYNGTNWVPVASETLPASDVMLFKGVIDCSTNPNYPAADAGNLYKVSVAGKIGGASGPNVEAGDTIYCITDSTASGNHATVGAQWVIAQVNIDGQVIGPASATNNNVALFDGATGKLIKESTVSAVLDQISSTQGVVLYRGASAWAALAPGVSGKVLTTNGAAANPSWETAAGGGGALTDITAGTGNASLETSGTITFQPSVPAGANTTGYSVAYKGGDASATAAGGTATLIGGSANGNAVAGGAALITGGAGSGTNSNGGPVTITAGAGGTTGTGGAISLTGGAASGSGFAGGAITITGGASNTLAGPAVSIAGGSGNSGGAVNITGAAPGTSGNVGGAVNVTTANAGVTNGQAGPIVVSVGSSLNSTSGNTISITAGNGGGAGGAVTVAGGTGGGATGGFVGGAMTVRGGAGGGNQAGGAASFQGGAAAGSGTGGAATLTAGAAGTSAGGTGGAVSVLATNGSSTSTGGVGGAVAITAGNAGGSGNNAGGNVTIQPGAATGTGNPGNIRLDGGRGNALSTSATGGFVTIPTCAGTPSGTPVNVPTGSVALVFDTSADKLWIYNGSWKSVTLA